MMVLIRLRELLELATRRATQLISPRYRPEMHYMRGPGPACAGDAGANPAKRERR
jgi:hypothetical protein